MKITHVSMREHRRFVPVQGWASVETALQAFACGATRDAHAAEAVTTRAIEDSSGGMGAAMFSLASVRGTSRGNFVERLLGQAKAGLIENDCFNKSYDYDGVGPFHKTTVDIDVIDRSADMYRIGLWAAYVGDKPEEGLAAFFGLPRTLLSCSVGVALQARSAIRFSIDFEPVMAKLNRVLKQPHFTGAAVAEALMAADEDEGVSVTLQEENGIQVCLAPDHVESRIRWNTGKRVDTWTCDGSVISGNRQRDYSSPDPNVRMPPTLSVVVRPVRKRRYDTVSVWQPERQAEMIDLAKKIAAAFK